MTVRELIEILKTLDPDAPLVVHGFLGGLDDLDSIVPVALVENVYQSETWRGAHESLNTIKRYESKEISSRTMSSDLRKHVQAVDGGTDAMPVVNAICLEGKSTAQTASSGEELDQDGAPLLDEQTNDVETTEPANRQTAIVEKESETSSHAHHIDNSDMYSGINRKPAAHTIMSDRRSANAG